MSNKAYGNSERGGRGSGDDFALRVIQGLERFRRRHRFEVALAGEVHDIFTDYGSIQAFICKHCLAENQLSPPLEGAPGRVKQVGCFQCGDVTNVHFHQRKSPTPGSGFIV